MKCADIQEMLAEYWDLPEQDERRQAIDAHLETCESCMEEFVIWQESAQLIRDTVVTMEKPPQYEPMSSQVMKRIYSEEKWRMPVSDRIYSFSYSLRRNATIAIAFFMTLFIVGLTLSIMQPASSADIYSAESNAIYGLKPVAVATSGSSTGSSVKTSKPITNSVVTASIKEPTMIRMGPIRSYPDYFIVLSLLGLTGTLLSLNWLSRTRS
ncbi:anti-sigma factor family protein [Paenibacillus koleovorans]|uniref:anti-sigma factor family protein n=1 Tax=Paenibacillus koleovorans TaxID=121608 RepID=UPI000FD95275|nr:zf-HC2 domain-containing protein [Paenibacillus koleovorans]